MRCVATPLLVGVMLGGGFLQSCRQPAEPAEAQAEPSQGLAAVERSEIVELIGLLAHPNELNRARAHEQLLQYLVVDVDSPEYPDRLTLFHKFAPHACRADHEAQTLHILELFAAQEDITSILVVQCLRSPHASVRAAARSLFATGNFDDIRIGRDGNVLVVVVAERPSISEINIDGNKAIETLREAKPTGAEGLQNAAGGDGGN